MEAVITSIVDAGDVRIFELRAAGGTPLPPYEPGAHVDVTLDNGITRQYSLCCAAPCADSYRIAVKRDPRSRGGSEWLHVQATVGGTLTIGAPRNAFALQPSAGTYLLFAGGIGITPVLSMAYALQRAGLPFQLAYFARSVEDLAFAGELATGPLADSVTLVCGLTPEGNAERIAAIMDATPVAGASVYTCGPAPFMDAVLALGTARFNADAVHRESFSPTASAGEQPFILRLVRAGCDIEVAVGSTALASLQQAGIDIDCSCEVGVCGTCRTAVIDGIPEHLDTVLSDAEKAANNCFMPCVSRSRTPVLCLDL